MNWRSGSLLFAVLFLIALVAPTFQVSFETGQWQLAIWPFLAPIDGFFVLLYAVVLRLLVGFHRNVTERARVWYASAGIALLSLAAVPMVYMLYFAAVELKSFDGIGSFDSLLVRATAYGTMWEALIIGLIVSTIAHFRNRDAEKPDDEPMVIPTRINSQTEPSA